MRILSACIVCLLLTLQAASSLAAQTDKPVVPPAATQPPAVPAAAQVQPGMPHPFSADDALVIYEVKHATPDDLKDILSKLIPSVLVLDGPRPKFVNKVFEGEKLGQEIGPGPSSVPGGPPNGSGQPTPEIKDEYVRILILSGPRADVTRAIAALNQIDLPAPLILIEAKIVEINIDKARALGIQWNFAPNGTTASFTLNRPSSSVGGIGTTGTTGTTGVTSTGGTTATGGTTSTGSTPSRAPFFGRLNGGDITFNATLEAAIQNNYAHLLASPRILTLDNKRAEIFVGQEISYLLAQIASQNGSTTVPGKVRVGVELNVTARYNPDDTISLRVHPEVGRLDQITSAATGVSLPQVSRRSVDTQIRIKNGQTFVIGGLIGEDKTRYIHKIPLLGDIPFLGYLFKREETSHVKTEIIIFIKASLYKDTQND